MKNQNRVVILLAAYDYESLHLTLESLTHTIDDEEQVVIVLNGKRGIRSAIVEDVARAWCAKGLNRQVAKPLNYGKDCYNSILEVMEELPVVKNAEFICKIDDDLIPLKKGWVDRLHQAYIALEKEQGDIGFTTSLINNNAWGFKRLVELYNKQKEYAALMNVSSQSGTGVVEAAQIADGRLGSVWQYPYLAKWIHGWTLCAIQEFIDKTVDLGIEEVPLDTHYSIGCMFFRKKLWLSLSLLDSSSNFDELLIHEYCKKYRLRKFAVKSEPMGHLFYYVQRIANRLILPKVKESLARYWNDDLFSINFDFDEMTRLEIVLEGYLSENADKLKTIQHDLEVVHKSSFYYKIRNAYRAVRRGLLFASVSKPKLNAAVGRDHRLPQVKKVKVAEELVKQ